MTPGAISVRRPLGTLALASAAVVIGAVAVSRLAVDLLPSVDAPRLTITTQYEGVAPEEIETLITRPIEQAVSTVEGVTELEATSSEGLSRVRLRFDWGKDLEVATNDVREMLDRIRARLPEEADPPTIFKFDLSQAPVATLGMSGAGDPRRLRYLAEEVFSRRLERVPGVAQVDVRGGRVREIEVRLDADRLAAFGVSAAQVSAALARENRNVAAGDMLERGREVVIRTEGEFGSTGEIEGVVVADRDGRSVKVADLGTVVDAYQELQAELWVDGVPGIRLRVAKQSGTNTVEVMEGVRAEMEAINRDYAGRLRLSVLSDGAAFVQSAVTNVQRAVLYGAGLALFVLLFFLRNVRATLVVATAIPISLLATFALMERGGVSMNVISLGGLALGVGMLVDGAIVILENSFRKMEDGVPVARAATEGAGEVSLAVVSGALTTIAVFVPVVFIEGFAGVFFREMAMVVSFALAASLVVALFVVPALISLVFRRAPRPRSGAVQAAVDRSNAAIDALQRGYTRVLRAALRHKWKTVGGSVGVLALSLAATPLVGVELMPETDEGVLDIDVELPVGTPLQTTMEVMQGLEKRVRSVLRDGELEHFETSAGPEASWRPVSGNEGEMEVNLVPVSRRERGIDEIMAAIRDVLADQPGAEIRVSKDSSNLLFRIMRGGDDRLSVEVHGHHIPTADQLAARVREAVGSVPGVTDTYVDREPGKMEQRLRVDRNRLAELGLTGADVAEAVEHYVLGRVATRYREGGDEFDVRVRLKAEDRQNVAQLASMPLPLPEGGTVPLGAVARIERTPSPASISRLNQERIVRVGIGVSAERPLDQIAGDVRQRLRGIDVPDGFALVIGGEQREQAETFSGMLVGVILAFLLVYAVLVVQFESLKQPVIIMTAVPFAVVGVVIALLLTGTTFNMNSFLGLIVLVGIVVNNAIILVDYTNQLRQRGLGVVEALIECGRLRLRPVLMTTSTTILGMLPLALGMGEGSEIQAPLGRAVVGGLAASTLVTLVFVPALYLAIEGRKVKAAQAGPRAVA
ncbi:MAG TPA: efflux RND transporter permease subunit [Myxococcaceae bacterium]|nr:efflux RND transporter permease subunit [Myxococcaceae bacterium]